MANSIRSFIKSIQDGITKIQTARAEKLRQHEAELNDLKRETNLVDEHFLREDELEKKFLVKINVGMHGSLEDAASPIWLSTKRWGHNEVAPPKQKSAAARFIQNQTEGFAPLLFVSAILHLCVGGMIDDLESTYVGVFQLLLSFVTGLVIFLESQKEVQKDHPINDIEKQYYTVRREGKILDIMGRDMVVGDIVVNLSHTHKVPADIRILSCTADLTMDTTVIAEEEPDVSPRNASLSDEEHPTHSPNFVFRGSDLVSGVLREGIVVRVGEETHIGRQSRLLHAIEEHNATASASQLEIQKCVKFFSLSAVCLAVLLFFVAVAEQANVYVGMKIIAGCLMAAVPSGFLVTTVIVFRSAANELLHLGTELKEIKTIETLSAVSCIIASKHGPLTENNTHVVSLVFADEDGEFIEHEASEIVYKSKHEDFYNSRNAEVLHRCAFAAQNPETRFVKQHEDVNHTRFHEKTGHLLPFKDMMHDPDTGEKVFHVQWDTVGSNPEDVAILKFFHDHPAAFRRRRNGKVCDFEECYELYPSLFHLPFSLKTGFEVHVRCAGAGPNAIENMSARRVYMRGHVGDVLARCSRFRDSRGPRDLTHDDIDVIDDTAKHMGTQGMTVIAYAESNDLPLSKYPAAYEYSLQPPGFVTPNFPMGERLDDYPEAEPEQIHPRATEGLVFLGLIGFYDDVHDVQHSLEECRMAGIRVVLATKDPPHAGLSLARHVGVVWANEADLDIEEQNEEIRHLENEGHDQDYIARQMSLRLGRPVEEVRENGLFAIRSTLGCEARVVDVTKCTTLEGQVRPLESMDDQWWEDLIQHSSQIVFTRAVGHHMQLIVDAFKEVGHTVMLTGLDASDATSLATADVGVSTKSSSLAAQASASVIMESCHFSALVHMISTGRRVYDNLKKTTAFLMASNVAQIVGFIAYAALEVPAPLVSSFVLLIDLCGNIPPAVALAREPSEADLMLAPPRHRHDSVMNFKLVFFAYLQIGMIEACACIFAYLVVMNAYGFAPHMLMDGAAKDNWGNYPLYCRYNGGHYVNTYGHVDLDRDPQKHPPRREYPLWDAGDGGYVKQCVHPLRAFVGESGFSKDFQLGGAASYTAQANGEHIAPVEVLDALEYNGYFEYIPWDSRMSSFWRTEWLSYDINSGAEQDGTPQIPDTSTPFDDVNSYNFHAKSPLGLWSICAADPYLGSDQGTVSATYESQLEAVSSYNAREFHHTLCEYTTSNKDAMFKNGRQYTKALFCNGDGYIRNLTAHGVSNEYKPFMAGDRFGSGMNRSLLVERQAACATFDEHPHQVQYCWDKCHYLCEPIPVQSRFNSSYASETKQCMNMASRLVQREAHYHARTAAFVAVVLCQIAAVVAIKTRRLSIVEHGFNNPALNVSLFFSVLFCSWTSYSDGFNTYTLTRPLRFVDFFPGMPWACMIIVYDEIRKLLIRRTSSVERIGDTERKVTGWLETNMYY